MKTTNKKQSWALYISNTEKQVFGIKDNGEVWYSPKGKLIKANTDKKLALAFAKGLETVVEINKKSITHYQDK